MEARTIQSDQSTSGFLLSKLRNHTQHYHQELEERFDVFNRLRDLDGYRELLLRLYGFYLPIEDKLASWASEFSRFGLSFERRSKLSLLLEDIRELGVELRLPAQSICRGDDLPPLNGFADAVGCFYVLEGSTLGAQVITKHLRTKFQTLNDRGVAFYQGYGHSTRQMWNEFCQFLGRYSADMESESEIFKVLAGARTTFERYGHWVCG